MYLMVTNKCTDGHTGDIKGSKHVFRNLKVNYILYLVLHFIYKTIFSTSY